MKPENSLVRRSFSAEGPDPVERFIHRWSQNKRNGPAPRRLQRRYIRAGDDWVFARVADAEGAEEPGTPVVFVHGVGVASLYFVPTAERVPARHPVLVPDLPGFGNSDPPTGGDLLDSMEELGDAVARVLDGAGIDRAILVGNSFGCQIASHAAHRHPDRVAGLVLQAPTGDPTAPSYTSQVLRWMRAGQYEPGPLNAVIVRDYLHCGLRRVLKTFQLSVKEDRPMDILPEIEAPTIVVRGACDPIVSQTWAEWIVDHMPDARLRLIEGAGHTLNFSHPNALLRAMRPLVSETASETDSQTKHEERDEAVLIGARRRSGADLVAAFDSASAMTRAVGRAIQDEPYPAAMASEMSSTRLLSAIGPVLNRLPDPLKDLIYAGTGWTEAVAPEGLDVIDLEHVAEWMVGHLPEQPVPGVVVGSSNGAVAHLCAAMGIPFLPQTFLMPVRHSGLGIDDFVAAMAWGEEHAGGLLDNNPDIQLHHMHDPVQDRLMSQRMGYFRLKWRRLPRAYRRYIRQCLAPGGFVLSVESGPRWPVVQVGERHVFQTGAVGGYEAEDYLHPESEPMHTFLEDQDARVEDWRVPTPDTTAPEAEWGFEPALADDVDGLARELGATRRRLRLDHPADASPAVAELFRSWYRQLGRPDDRLQVSSFIVMNPRLALRGALVPYWMVFNKKPSARALSSYIDRFGPFEQIYASVFSHGVDSPDLATAEQWERQVERARGEGELVAVDEGAYPRDFAVLVRHFTELSKRVDGELPPRLPLEAVDDFFASRGDGFDVRWHTGA